MAIVSNPFPVSTLHDAIALQPLNKKDCASISNLTHCGAAHAARIAGLNGNAGPGIVLEVDEFIAALL